MCLEVGTKNLAKSQKKKTAKVNIAREKIGAIGASNRNIIIILWITILSMSVVDTKWVHGCWRQIDQKGRPIFHFLDFSTNTTLPLRADLRSFRFYFNIQHVATLFLLEKLDSGFYTFLMSTFFPLFSRFILCDEIFAIFWRKHNSFDFFVSNPMEEKKRLSCKISMTNLWLIFFLFFFLD